MRISVLLIIARVVYLPVNTVQLSRPLSSRLLKITVIAVGVILLSAITTYFYLKANLKTIAADYVSTYSGGAYQLQIDELRFSLWNLELELKNAGIFPADNTAKGAQYEIHLPHLYLKINSLLNIFRGQLSADSVYIQKPLAMIHDDGKSASEHDDGLTTSEIFQKVSDALSLLQVRSFHLDSGSLILKNSGGDPPLTCHDVTIWLANIGKHIGKEGPLPATDEIRIEVPAQSWTLDDGRQHIEFSRFVYSGHTQYFKVDSLQVRNRSTDGKDSMILRVDEFAFRSKKLQQLYANDVLTLDTLMMNHPVLMLISKEKEEEEDSLIAIENIIKSVYFDFTIGFLSIGKGQVAIETTRDGKTASYETGSTDLVIEALAIRHRQTPFLTTGKVMFDAKETTLFTADSLYQLTFETLEFKDNDVHLQNTVFKPTARNRHQYISSGIKEFILVNLDLESMFDKRLKADRAMVIEPAVSISIPPGRKDSSASTREISVFYNTLHELSSMLSVRQLSIYNGSVNLRTVAGEQIDVSATGVQAEILLERFLDSEQLMDIKSSIPLFEAGQLNMQSGKLQAQASNFNLQGRLQKSGLGELQLTFANGMTLLARDVSWLKLEWDELRNNGAVIADSVHLGSLTVINPNAVEQMVSDTTSMLPRISIGSLIADELQFRHAIYPAGIATAEGRNLVVSGLQSDDEIFRWQTATGEFSEIAFDRDQTGFSVSKITFQSDGVTSLYGLEFKLYNETQQMLLSAPEMYITTSISSTDFSQVEFEAVSLFKPSVTLLNKSSPAVQPNSHSFAMPANFAINRLFIEQATFTFQPAENTNASGFTITGNVEATGIQTMKGQTQFAMVNHAALELNNQLLPVTDRPLSLSSFSMLFTDMTFEKTGTVIRSTGNVSGKWSDAAVEIPIKNQGMVSLKHFTGRLDPIWISYQQGDNLNWVDWVKNMHVNRGQVQFDDSARNIYAANIRWMPDSRTLSMDSLQYYPKTAVAEYFLTSTWQSDLIKASAGHLSITGIDLDRLQMDSMLLATKLMTTDAFVDVWRDKRVPFQHGILKPMPTRLLMLSGSEFGIDIDSVVVINGSVSYREYSAVTNLEGHVPLRELNVTATNLKNRNITEADTFHIAGEMQLLGTQFRNIRYQESYHDSLSAFRMSCTAQPASLVAFSQITRPLAAIEVNSGISDRFEARFTGNRDAAFGEMRFYYNDLKVSLLDHHDSLRHRIDLAFINFVTNEFVIKTNNKKRVRMFFVRDRERFVFSYWVKTIMSGVMASAGIKGNKKYYKNFEESRLKYQLPDEF